MTIPRALATLTASAALTAGFGALLGLSLGKFLPNYYRSLCRNGWDTGYDSVSVGIGLGLSQGPLVGVIIGFALIALLNWQQNPAQSAHHDSSTAPNGGPIVRMMVSIAIAVVTLYLPAATFIVGAVIGEQGAYHRRFLEEQRELEVVLVGDSAFGGISVNEYSGGGALVHGDVATEEDLKRLTTIVERATGRAQARRSMSGVGVRQTGPLNQPAHSSGKAESRFRRYNCRCIARFQRQPFVAKNPKTTLEIGESLPTFGPWRCLEL